MMGAAGAETTVPIVEGSRRGTRGLAVAARDELDAAWAALEQARDVRRLAGAADRLARSGETVDALRAAIAAEELAATRHAGALARADDAAQDLAGGRSRLTAARRDLKLPTIVQVDTPKGPKTITGLRLEELTCGHVNPSRLREVGGVHLKCQYAGCQDGWLLR